MLLHLKGKFIYTKSNKDEENRLLNDSVSGCQGKGRHSSANGVHSGCTGDECSGVVIALIDACAQNLFSNKSMMDKIGSKSPTISVDFLIFPDLPGDFKEFMLTRCFLLSEFCGFNPQLGHDFV